MAAPLDATAAINSSTAVTNASNVLYNTTAVTALLQQSLGLGFSESGYLLLYLIGVLSTLSNLGLLDQPGIKFAGASGGAVVSAATCAGVPVPVLYNRTLSLLRYCRDHDSCQGTLDDQMRALMNFTLPPDAAERCSGRETVAMTVVNDNKTNPGPDLPLLVDNFTSTRDLQDAVAGSAFISLFSAPGATTTTFRGKPVYDGRWTSILPCPNVSYCVHIQAFFPGSPRNTSGFRKSLEQAGVLIKSAETVLALASGASLPVYGANETQAPPPETVVDNITGTLPPSSPPPVAVEAFVPINPPDEDQPWPTNVDIAPGMYEPVNFTALQWTAFSLNPANDSVLEYMYQLGMRDAAAWAERSGVAAAAAVQPVEVQQYAAALG